jgi:hypothetical protein
MNYRNAKRLANGWIDCAIEHDTLGWIPFTCDPSDTGALFDVAELHAQMDADPSTSPYEPPTQEDVLADATAQARERRAELLAKNVDPYVMNALRWADLSVEQQGDISAYRRALLDITDQSGFPLEVVWPELPAFMR